MSTLHLPYFLQTKDWTDFWIKSVDTKHQIHYISHESEEISLSAYIYHYPWHVKQTFLYIPKGPYIQVKKDIDHTALQREFRSFLTKITELAQKEKATFIKIDADDYFTSLLEIHSNDKLLHFIRSCTPHTSIISKKSLQYLSTMVLDCGDLVKEENPQQFLLSNSAFWSKTNENIRRYTRKSLKQNWSIDTDKTPENFEHFWQVYTHTAQRQEFAIHPKSYFEAMFKHDFVRIITLKDEQGVPHCCWFGVKIDDTLYYLYGGNDTYSFEHYGQYLMHLVATQIAAREGVKYYDLGGYDSTKGFGKFKEGYRGRIIQFLGPVDIVLKKPEYFAIFSGIQAIKMIKSIIRK
jgi:lipid II:glycine glycyltransferase (peptidoglycan interpeptide bridge formation enzyme)